MKTAIVGLGNIGACVAKNLVEGGESIILAARDQAKARALAKTLGRNAEVASIDEAIKRADILILGIWFETIKQFIGAHRTSLVGKILVDPSNPIAPDGKGGFTKIIAADQSAGQVIAGLLPEGAKLVKAFGTTSAQSLESGTNRKPEPAVLFYATDNPDAGRAVAKLIAASGFAPIAVGGINHSIRIEAFGDLHEYGKLGRLVNGREAAELIKSAA